MKKLLLLLFFVIYCHAIGKAQNPAPLYYQGMIDSLYSEVLGETRYLYIYEPQSTRQVEMAKTEHPVLYLLDANSQFALTSQMVRTLSNFAIPPMMIVSIINTNRTRDLTPTHVPSDPTGYDLSQSGGGETFLDFIEKELIPYIDQNYKTTPYRTFIGHSLGGLLSGYTLATRPHLFNNVISLDPTSTWDDELMYRSLKETGDKGGLAGKGYVLAVADPEPTGDKIIDSLLTTFRIPNDKMAGYLDQVEGLDFQFKNYPKGNHTDMVIPGTYDGLKFLFSWYADLNQQMIDAADPFISKDLSDEELIARIEEIHRQMSDHFGYQVLPKEDMINSLGYWSLQAGAMNRSKLLFEMNIANYPESANVYDSMGDYYMATGDSVEAARYFREALKRDENPGTRAKLEQIENKGSNE